MSKSLDSNYWQLRWNEGQTGWDIGYASTPIAEYIDQLSDKSIKILIPGCGNAWEGEYLFKNGFTNTWVIDIAPAALENLRHRFPHFPKDQLIEGDFFEHNGSYDIIFEQTFFARLILRFAGRMLRRCTNFWYRVADSSGCYSTQSSMMTTPHLAEAGRNT